MKKVTQTICVCVCVHMFVHVRVFSVFIFVGVGSSYDSALSSHQKAVAWKPVINKLTSS